MLKKFKEKYPEEDREVFLVENSEIEEVPTTIGLIHNGKVYTGNWQGMFRLYREELDGLSWVYVETVKNLLKVISNPVEVPQKDKVVTKW
jgi:hypothetical protein